MTVEKPEVHAWFMGDEIADDDPLAAVKRRALAIDAAAEETEAAARRGHAAARADQLGEAAALFADSAFDPRDVWDAAAAAGLTDGDLDAASYVVLELENIERGYPGS